MIEALLGAFGAGPLAVLAAAGALEAARQAPTMRGRRWRLDQALCGAVWLGCVLVAGWLAVEAGPGPWSLVAWVLLALSGIALVWGLRR